MLSTAERPSPSVTATIGSPVPLSSTVTPGKAPPVSSVTLPVTLPVWAQAGAQESDKIRTSAVFIEASIADAEYSRPGCKSAAPRANARFMLVSGEGRVGSDVAGVAWPRRFHHGGK